MAMSAAAVQNAVADVNQKSKLKIFNFRVSYD